MGCIKSKEEQSARVLDLSGQVVGAGDGPAEGNASRGTKGVKAAGGVGVGDGRGGGGSGSGSRSGGGSGSGSGPEADAAWAAAEPAGERDILTLRGLALFAGLGDSALLRAAKALTRVTFPANAIVYREGEANDRFFILGNGEAVLTFKDHRGFNIELREMIAGDFVNEVSLFSPSRAHCTTLSTMADCVFYVLEKRRVSVFARALPELSRELEASCRDRESMTNALCGMSAFKTLRPDKREVLLEFCEVKKYAPSHIVVEQGKEAFRRCFYIIVSGSVEVLVDGKRIGTLGKHSYFGDVSVMSLEPTYSATIQVPCFRSFRCAWRAATANSVTYSNIRSGARHSSAICRRSTRQSTSSSGSQLSSSRVCSARSCASASCARSASRPSRWRSSRATCSGLWAPLSRRTTSRLFRPCRLTSQVRSPRTSSSASGEETLAGTCLRKPSSRFTICCTWTTLRASRNRKSSRSSSRMSARTTPTSRRP
jgi:CRP-like cAMP-binding protein